VTAPLRIGILGAARIADEGIVAPARTLGHEVVSGQRRANRRVLPPGGTIPAPRVADNSVRSQAISSPLGGLVGGRRVHDVNKWHAGQSGQPTNAPLFGRCVRGDVETAGPAPTIH